MITLLCFIVYLDNLDLSGVEILNWKKTETLRDTETTINNVMSKLFLVVLVLLLFDSHTIHCLGMRCFNALIYFFAYKIGYSSIVGSSKLNQAAQKKSIKQSGIFAYSFGIIFRAQNVLEYIFLALL